MKMNERLYDLYHIPSHILPQEVYLMDLAEQCANLEAHVRELAVKLSARDRKMLVGYLELRDELEYQSVKTALRFSKYIK